MMAKLGHVQRSAGQNYDAMCAFFNLLGSDSLPPAPSERNAEEDGHITFMEFVASARHRMWTDADADASTFSHVASNYDARWQTFDINEDGHMSFTEFVASAAGSGLFSNLPVCIRILGVQSKVHSWTSSVHQRSQLDIIGASGQVWNPVQNRSAVPGPEGPLSRRFAKQILDLESFPGAWP